MSQQKEYSSLPVAVAIATAVLMSTVGGWFLLGQDASARIDSDDNVAFLPPETITSNSVTAGSYFDIDAEIRKARFAADADFVVSPPQQNAVYYYGRVLAADPGHLLANAEMEAVLARASLIVDDLLSAGDFDEAYDVASRVAAQRPEHPLLDSIRDSLSDYAAELVARARQTAKDGNDTGAADLLTQLERLPGLSIEYVEDSRASVIAIQEARSAAEQTLIDENRLAEEKAISDWAEKIRAAIESGRLIAPEGDNASVYLAERASPAATKAQLTFELVTALMTASEQSIDSGNLADVESYLQVVNHLVAEVAADSGDGEDGDATETIDRSSLKKLRDSVESKLIAAESNRVVGLAKFVRRNNVPANYPPRANRNNVTGWVDVEFTVTTSGETANIEVREAVPENVFERSALEAVQQWTFQPREYRGQPINQRTAARLVFELE